MLVSFSMKRRAKDRMMEAGGQERLAEFTPSLSDNVETNCITPGLQKLSIAGARGSFADGDAVEMNCSLEAPGSTCQKDLIGLKQLVTPQRASLPTEAGLFGELSKKTEARAAKCIGGGWGDDRRTADNRQVGS